jgi:hypothetical protein
VTNERVKNKCSGGCGRYVKRGFTYCLECDSKVRRGRPTPFDLFWRKVEQQGPEQPDGTRCWVWTASLHEKGYGRISDPDKQGGWSFAHRWAYERLVGPIPEGLQLDHLCRNRACVNPSHLEPVTLRENLLRGNGSTGSRARQTHCKHGHELTEANVYRWPGRPNTRQCRACARRNNRIQDERRRRLRLREHDRALPNEERSLLRHQEFARLDDGMLEDESRTEDGP